MPINLPVIMSFLPTYSSTVGNLREYTPSILKRAGSLSQWLTSKHACFGVACEVILKKDQVYYIQNIAKSSFLQITSHLELVALNVRT